MSLNSVPPNSASNFFFFSDPFEDIGNPDFFDAPETSNTAETIDIFKDLDIPNFFDSPLQSSKTLNIVENIQLHLFQEEQFQPQQLQTHQTLHLQNHKELKSLLLKLHEKFINLPIEQNTQTSKELEQLEELKKLEFLKKIEKIIEDFYNHIHGYCEYLESHPSSQQEITLQEELNGEHLESYPFFIQRIPSEQQVDEQEPCQTTTSMLTFDPSVYFPSHSEFNKCLTKHKKYRLTEIFRTFYRTLDYLKVAEHRSFYTYFIERFHNFIETDPRRTLTKDGIDYYLTEYPPPTNQKVSQTTTPKVDLECFPSKMQFRQILNENEKYTERQLFQALYNEKPNEFSAIFQSFSSDLKNFMESDRETTLVKKGIYYSLQFLTLAKLQLEQKKRQASLTFQQLQFQHQLQTSLLQQLQESEDLTLQLHQQLINFPIDQNKPVPKLLKQLKKIEDIAEEFQTDLVVDIKL